MNSAAPRQFNRAGMSEGRALQVCINVLSVIALGPFGARAKLLATVTLKMLGVGLCEGRVTTRSLATAAGISKRQSDREMLELEALGTLTLGKEGNPYNAEASIAHVRLSSVIFDSIHPQLSTFFDHLRQKRRAKKSPHTPLTASKAEEAVVTATARVRANKRATDTLDGELSTAMKRLPAKALKAVSSDSRWRWYGEDRAMRKRFRQTVGWLSTRAGGARPPPS